jgi:hypothetical protein
MQSRANQPTMMPLLSPSLVYSWCGYCVFSLGYEQTARRLTGCNHKQTTDMDEFQIDRRARTLPSSQYGCGHKGWSEEIAQATKHPIAVAGCDHTTCTPRLYYQSAMSLRVQSNLCNAIGRLEWHPPAEGGFL